MARFIVDTDVKYLTDKPKNKKEFTVKEIKTDIKELQNIILNAITNYHNGCVSITYHKTGNTIQIMPKEQAKRIRKLTERRGYGTMLRNI